VSTLLLAAIRLYQRTLSPAVGVRCRFEPTCSHYAHEAIQQLGAGKGAWLALRRLARCYPGRPGGYDPVPAPQSGRLHKT